MLIAAALLVAPLAALAPQAPAQAAAERTILVLSKDPYTDSDEEDAEITAALRAEFGAGNVTVTDGGNASALTWSVLLTGVDTLVIPEQNSGLTIWQSGRTEALRDSGAETWPITDEAMSVIRAWAEVGGVIMGTGSYSHRDIIQYLTGQTYSVWWDDYPGNYVRGPWDAEWQTWDYGWFSRMVDDTSIPERLPGADWTGGMTIAYANSASPANDQAWTPAERATVTVVYGYDGPYYGGPATETIEQIGVGVFAVGQGSYIYYAYDWFPNSLDRDRAKSDPTHTEWWNLALVLGAGGQISAAAAAGGGGTTTTTTTDSGGSGPILTSEGSIPTLQPGAGSMQSTDGTTVPLRITNPSSRVVRYESEGLRVTLTGARGTDATRGLVATPEGTIECEVCAFLAAGGVIEAWLFSDPRLAAAWRVGDTDAFLAGLPCQRFTIPVGAPLDGRGPVPAGLHTLQLQLPTADGVQAVNIGVTIGSLTPRTVPAGEGSEDTGTRTAALSVLTSLLILGAMLGRRRTVGQAG
jgi:hypothetical protein